MKTLFRAAFVALLGLPSLSSASEPFAKDGVYIAAMGVHSGLNGDFSGNSVLVNPVAGEALLVPRFHSAMGWGAALGVEGGAHSVEVNYARSSHEVLFQQARGSATYNAISLDYRYSFFTRARVQPHLLIGWVPVAWASVKDASANGNGEVGDATFWSFALGLNLGAGLTVYPVDRVFVSASAGYRLILFTSASGVDSGMTPLESKLNGSAPHFVGRVGFMF